MKNVIFKGLRIRIENPAGSVRSGVDRVSGKPWSTKMSHDYGEIIGTNGVDDDPVDVFIGNNKSAPFVHVVHQLNKQTGEWDEDKCFLGFNDVMDAKAAYYKNYDNPDLFYGDIETMPFHLFKKKMLTHKGDTMIHASVTVGDPVIVDGLRGRGVIVSEDGSDVVIRYRNGEYFKRKKYNVHSFNETNYHSRYQTVQAGEEDVEMERGPITVPHGMNKRIEKVGTLFCVVADGVDKNFGCYGSRAQAEAVMSGKSFIEPDIPGGMYAQDGNPKPIIPKAKPPETISAIPKMAPIKKYAAPRVATPPKPSSIIHPNETVHHKFTNKLGIPLKVPGAHKTLEGFGDLGEPMAGALGHAHIEPEFWFHPPSLEKRNRADHIPTDDPGESNNKFLDVTKRRQAHKDRMKILKHGRPGGNPPITPAITTGMAPQMAGSAVKLTKRKGNKLLLDVINPRTASLVVPHQTNGYTKGIKARRTQDIRVRRAFNAAFI